MKPISLVVAMLMTCSVGSAQAAVVTIDPNNYVSGQDLGNPYPGVTLSTVQGYVNFVDNDPTPTLIEPIHITGGIVGSVSAYGSFFKGANQLAWGADIPDNLPTLTSELFMATFAMPVEYVSMTFFPDVTDIDTGVLGVFGANGDLLSHQFFRDRYPFTLSFSSQGTPIAYLLASTADPGKLGSLSFQTSSVPAPPTFILMLAGLGLIGLTKRLHKTS